MPLPICHGWRVIYFVLLIPLLFVPLFLRVSELHRNNSTAMEAKGKKFDHLVLGPAAGHGLANRVQCQGLNALNKITSRSANQESSLRDHVSFITVFAVYNSSLSSVPSQMNDKSSDIVTVGQTSYNRLERSVAIINTFISFIQVSMPKSNIIILTDPSSGFAINRSNTEIFPIEGDYSRGNLMLQRIMSYIAFLDTRLEFNSGRPKYTKHYIFTDSDVAVVDDVGHIFEKYPHFHLALTFRNNKNQPLNSGFIAVRGTLEGIQRAKDFLQKVLSIYSSRYMEASRMLGDQLALAWAVKTYIPSAAKKFTRPEAFFGDINGASILFLPCLLYNWTPPEGAGQFHGMPLDIQVVHFKGSRKRLMLESWNFFNSTSSMPNMLCLILKSGRTKYDF